MRYSPEHKAEIHEKIVKDAARRVRAEGIAGAAVSAVMRDAGLTHGGFYKHFESKDELLMASLREGFREIEERLAQAGERSPRGTAWKAIVKTYLSEELCDHVERGCPLAALGPELARTGRALKAPIFEELKRYKDRMVPFMPPDRRQGACVLRYLFDDDRSDDDRPQSSRPGGAGGGARRRAGFSLAQLLSRRLELVSQREPFDKLSTHRAGRLPDQSGSLGAPGSSLPASPQMQGRLSRPKG
jgi:TetR/AcrR family transcriptional repressor of nem operon